MKTTNRIRAKAKVVNPIRVIVMEPQICGRVVKIDDSLPAFRRVIGGRLEPAAVKATALGWCGIRLRV